MNIFFQNTKITNCMKLYAEQQILSSLNFAGFVVNGSCSLLLSFTSVLHTDMFVSNNFRLTKNVLKEHK